MVGQRDVVRGRDEVGGKEERLTPISYLNPLLTGSVAVNAMNPQTRNDLCVSWV
jgi:hypothetical protein